MSYLSVTQNENVVSLTAGATDLARRVFVTLTAGLVVICDADDDVNVIGVTTDKASAGEAVGVALLNGTGVNKVACGEAIDLGDVIYVGASGTAVDTQPTGKVGIGLALNATVTAGDEVSFLAKNPYTDTDT